MQRAIEPADQMHVVPEHVVMFLTASVSEGTSPSGSAR
jgi:hypothetical protein